MKAWTALACVLLPAAVPPSAAVVRHLPPIVEAGAVSAVDVAKSLPEGATAST